MSIDVRSWMIQSFKTLLRLRVLLSWLRKIATPLQSCEERLKNAGSLSKLPRKRKRRPEKLSRVLRMRLPNSTRLLRMEVVFPLAMTTKSVSLSLDLRSFKRKLIPRKPRLMILNFPRLLLAKKLLNMIVTSSKRRRKLRKSNIKLRNLKKSKSNKRETRSFMTKRRRRLRKRPLKES